MNWVAAFVLIVVSVLNALASDDTVRHDHEDGIVSFEKAIIVSKSHQAIALDSDRLKDNTLISAQDIALKLVDRKEIGLLSLASQALTDSVFAEIKQEIVRSGTVIEVLDLSGNSLSPKSASVLIDLLLNESHSVGYINLNRNLKCSMKNISTICKELAQVLRKDGVPDFEAIRKVTDRLCFLPKYYIWHAKNKVRVYERLQELGYLSADWDEKQREIYRKIALHKKDGSVEFEKESLFDEEEDNLSIEDDLSVTSLD